MAERRSDDDFAIGRLERRVAELERLVTELRAQLRDLRGETRDSGASTGEIRDLVGSREMVARRLQRMVKRIRYKR